MAPTGVSAINIKGTTINTGLAIPKETGENLPVMSDQKKTQIRVLLSELKLIIIDEVSMVSNITLLHIHQRLKDIFGSNSSQLFAGISILLLVIYTNCHQYVENQFFTALKMSLSICSTHGMSL